MITEWMIYWITRLDGLQGFFIAIAVITGIASIILSIAGGVIAGNLGLEGGKKAWRYLFKTIPAALFFILLACLTPTTKEMVAIYAIPKIINNEQIQEMPVNVAELVNNKLKEWMKDVGLDDVKEIVKGGE